MAAKLATTALLVGALFATFGCGDEPPAPPAAAPAAPSAPSVPAEPAGPRASSDSFELRAEGDTTYAASALSRFGITLTAKEPWHVNQDYPIAIRLTAPDGVALGKTTLGREDAASFEDEEARFDVPFTPSAPGEHEVQAQVSFAMCTDENCVMEDRTLALRLAVR